MVEDIKVLSAKMDKILAQQELILNRLEHTLVLESPRNSFTQKAKNKQKKESVIQQVFRAKLKEDITLDPHKIRLQQQFNLVLKPHNNRVKEYLETNNPTVFDGLLRSN